MPKLTKTEKALLSPVQKSIGNNTKLAESLNTMFGKIIPDYAGDAVKAKCVEDPLRCPSVSKKAGVDCEDGASMFVRLLSLASDELFPFLVFCLTSSASVVSGTQTESGHATTVLVAGEQNVENFLEGKIPQTGHHPPVYLCESTGHLHPSVFSDSQKQELAGVRFTADLFYKRVLCLVAPTGAMFVPRKKDSTVQKLCKGQVPLKQVDTLKALDTCVFNPFRFSLPDI
jgi:hypothetical protein